MILPVVAVAGQLSVVSRRPTMMTKRKNEYHCMIVRTVELGLANINMRPSFSREKKDLSPQRAK